MQHHYFRELKTWLFHMVSLQTAFLESVLTWSPMTTTKNSITMKEIIIQFFAATLLCFPSTKHMFIASKITKCNMSSRW